MLVKLLLVCCGSAGALLTADGTQTWSATLQPRGGSRTTGSARLESVGTDSLRLTLNLQHARPHATLAWAIHHGKCSEAGAVWGTPESYPPLETDFTGETWEVVYVTEAPPNGAFSVVIHSGAELTGGIAACGNLATAP